MYSATTVYQKKVLSVTGLTNTTHTVTLTTMGFGQINSTGSTVTIDAFDIHGGNIA